MLFGCLWMALGYFGAFGQSSFYDFTVRDIQGEEFPLARLAGKKVMVVNVASRCGLTPQYEQLQSLYEAYREKDFVIIGFPANNFREQEPGTDEEILTFCQANYGVTFPIMSKISVRDEAVHPLYQWLTRKELNGVADAQVQWNFHKFLIDENGNWVRSVSPTTLPDAQEIIDWLEGNP